MEYVLLNDNAMMPQHGYGIHLISPDECGRCSSDALKVATISTAIATRNLSNGSCHDEESDINLYSPRVHFHPGLLYLN
ncbi:MAG: hypothetical protein ACOYJG_04100 [Prevotella sp.]|jgi:2,5-diketo-D-gluconate reductase A